MSSLIETIRANRFKSLVVLDVALLCIVILAFVYGSSLESEGLSTLNAKQIWIIVGGIVLLAIILITTIIIIYLVKTKNEIESKPTEQKGQQDQKEQDQNKERVTEARVLILEMKKRGYNEAFIKKTFVDKGWPESLVDSLLNS